MQQKTFILALSLLVLNGLYTPFAISAPQTNGNVVPPPPDAGDANPDQAPSDDTHTTGNPDEPPKTELDLMQDPTIKVEVEPLVISNLVDRVVEPATIYIHCPDPISADIYLLAVDAPYGGKPLENPHLLGKGVHSANGFKVRWENKEPSPYVKIFAVVRRRSAPDRLVRSHTIDLAIGGTRLEQAAQPPTKK